jgi:hypothetical protein
MKTKFTKKLMAFLGVVLLFTSSGFAQKKITEEERKAQIQKFAQDSIDLDNHMKNYSKSPQKAPQARIYNESDTALMRKQRCDFTVKEASYIFEGKLISSKNFRSTDGGYYTSNSFEVNEVISGSLQKGTVEIVERRYNYTDDEGGMIRTSDGHSFIYNGTTLYFCSDAKASELNSGISNTNTKVLNIVDGTAFSGDKITQHDHYSVFSWFTTMSEFYTFLRNNNGIKVSKTLFEKKSPISTQTEKKHKIINQAEELAKFERVKQIRAQRLQQYQSTQHTVNCAEIFISEYLDGQNSDNAVEVYNPTASPISLSNYKLLIYHNASLTPTTIALTGTISAYSTHVIAQNGASSYILSHANQTTSNLNFSGNVTTVLSKGTTHIDKIGEIGVANSSGSWTLTPSGGTNNTDIRRKYNIGVGDTSWSNCKSEWDVFSQDSTHNLGHQLNVCSTIPDPDLIFSLANPQTTGTSPKYFEFDIYVSGSDNSTYLEDMQLRFNYNTAAFGTKISLNNKLTLTNLGSFADTLNYGNNFQTDHAPYNSVVSVGLSANYNYNSYNLTNITTSPQPLMHAKIEIANCNVPANISFYYLDSLKTACDYALSSHQTFSQFPTLYTNVDSLSGSSHLKNLTCGGVPMQITDFNSPVLAGVGNTVTIVGTGFGNTRGNGQVKFTNADDGGTTHLHGINANDYISWSDTQIQLTMPSFADTINPIDSNLIGGMSFIVTNNAGLSAFSGLNSSGSSFVVYFSLLDLRNISSHNKNRVNLRETDTSGGYILRLNPTNFPVGSPQRIVFTKAVHDWVCLTGVNLEIGKDTTITNANPVMNDGVSYVFFGASPLLGGTQHWAEYCSTDITSLKEADIKFTTNFTFAYDTNTTHNIPAGEYDFYETATHELGHYLGLEHNVISTDLMYYNETPGNAAAQRKHLVLGTSSTDGAIYNYNHSSSVLSIPGNCWIAMTVGRCSAPAAGIDNIKNNNVFNLYPNPAKDNIVIQSTASNGLGAITIYNMLGEVVYSQTTKDNKTQIDVSQQASGVYLIKVQNQIIKLIKN